MTRFPMLPYQVAPSEPDDVSMDMRTLLPDSMLIPKGTAYRRPLTDAQIAPAVRGDIGLDEVSDPILRLSLREAKDDPLRWERLQRAVTPPPPPPATVAQPAAPMAAAPPAPAVDPARVSKYMGQPSGVREVNARNLHRKAAAGNANARLRLMNLADNFGDPFAQQALADLSGRSDGVEEFRLGRVPTIGGRPASEIVDLSSARGASPTSPTGVASITGQPAPAPPTVEGTFTGVAIPDPQRMTRNDWMSAVLRMPDALDAVRGEAMQSAPPMIRRNLERLWLARTTIDEDGTLDRHERQRAEDRIANEEMRVLYGWANSGAIKATSLVERRRMAVEQQQRQQQLEEIEQRESRAEERRLAGESRMEEVRSRRTADERAYSERQDAAKSRAEAEKERRKEAAAAEKEAKMDRVKESERIAEERKYFARLVSDEYKAIDPVKMGEDGKAVPMEDSERWNIARSRARQLLDIASGEVGGSGAAPKPSADANPARLPISMGPDGRPYPRADTPEQAASLPSGTVFIDANGVRRRVP